MPSSTNIGKMINKEIKNISLSSEHTKGEYNINNNKGLGHYSYIYIVTENLGAFYISYLNNNGLVDIRTDSYPWLFLMKEINYQLTSEQIKFVKDNKKSILMRVRNIHQ